MCVVRVDIVLGKDPGQLIVTERLVMPGCCQVSGPTVVAGQCAVRHLSEKPLDESVGAALGAPRIVIDCQHLALDEMLEHRLDRVRLGPGHGPERGESE